MASALLVCAFAAGLIDDFVHTDDGCAIETHCLACQRLLVSMGAGIVLPASRPSIDVLGRVTPRDVVSTPEADAPSRASRAPPLA